MQFCIDEDAGTFVAGWIVPNNPNGTPSIKVVLEGEEVAIVQANIHRQDIKDIGIHSTGLVGFHLDDHTVPGLSAAEELELIDAETGILVHRRSSAPVHIEERVMFFNLCVVPQIRMRNHANDLFRLTYSNSERINYDTIYSILANHRAKSLFAMGRTNHNRISEVLINNNYRRMALIRDPLIELAERIILIKQISRSPNRMILENTIYGLENLMAFCDTVDLEDIGSLSEGFEQLRPQQVQAIADPFLRALVCDAGDEPESRHISLGLDRLAEFDIIGVEERIDAFNICVMEVFDKDIFGGYESYLLPGVTELAERLQDVEKAIEYIEYDAMLYSEVRSIIDSEFPTSS